MLRFKQKEFWVGLALSAASTVGGLIQGHKANKINQANAEAQLQQQKKMDRERLKLEKQQLEMNKKLANVAGQDPMAAATALQSQQKSYSNNFVKEGLGFVKNVAGLSKDAGKRLLKTAAQGAVGVSAAYAVDKAIQRDAKKSGFDIAYEDTEEDRERRKRNRRKRALKLGIGASTLAGGVIAAKKGVLGEDIKKASEAINKENIIKTGKKVGHYAMEGVKDLFTKKDKNGKITPDYLGIAATAAPLVIPVIRYVSSKKQLKEQIKQSEGEEKEKKYSERKKETPENRLFLYLLKKNVKKKPVEKKYTLILKKNKKPKKKEPIETKIFKTYLSLKARKFSKVEDSGNKVKDNVIKKMAKSFKKRPMTFILDLGSKIKGGGGLKGVNRFGRRLQEAGEKSGNITSQRVGNFIKENPKTALLGSIVIGSGIIKASKLGYNKTRKFIEDHDKNAFAYEKSQGMIVPKESKNEEDDN